MCQSILRRITNNNSIMVEEDAEDVGEDVDAVGDADEEEDSMDTSPRHQQHQRNRRRQRMGQFRPTWTINSAGANTTPCLLQYNKMVQQLEHVLLLWMGYP